MISEIRNHYLISFKIRLKITHDSSIQMLVSKLCVYSFISRYLFLSLLVERGVKLIKKGIRLAWKKNVNCLIQFWVTQGKL